MRFVEADGLATEEAVGGQRFAGVLCHGVIGYLEEPEPLVAQLCRCAADGCVMSIMTCNAHAGAVRPALERRWDEALAAFDARHEIGVLGVRDRADTVEELATCSGAAGSSRRTGTACGCSWTGWSSPAWGPYPDDEDRVRSTAAVSSRPAGVTPTDSRAACSTWSVAGPERLGLVR